MFGGLGGIAAMGIASGIQSGWNFADQARSSAQNRKLREQEYQRRSLQMMKEMQEDAMKTFSLQQISQKTGAGVFDDPQVAMIAQQNQQLQQKVAQMQGTETKRSILDYMKASPEERVRYVGQLRNDPVFAEAMKIKNPKTLRTLDWSNPNDRRDIQQYYAKFGGPKLKLMEPAQLERFMKNQADQRLIVSADGHVVHAGDLAKGMGVSIVQDPNDAEQIMQQKKENVQETGGDVEVKKQVPGSAQNIPTESTALTYYPTPREVPNEVVKQYVGQVGIPNERVAKEYLSVKPKAQSFYNDFARYMKQTHGIDVAIGPLGGGRDKKDQAELYAKGRTKPGKKVTWTMHSNHIGGNAIDVVSADVYTKGYNDPNVKKQNEFIAQEMRKFAEANPNYGAGFLSMSKDPNHVQFTASADKGTDLPATEKTTPATEKTASAAETNIPDEKTSWMDQPYKSTGPIADKWELYTQLAGLKDTRPAEIRTMDYVAQKLGPDATTGEVFEAYNQWKQSGQQPKEFLYDRGLKAIQEEMSMKYGLDWQQKPEAVDEYKAKYSALNERYFGGGASEVREQSDRTDIATAKEILSKQASGQPLTPEEESYLNQIEGTQKLQTDERTSRQEALGYVNIASRAENIVKKLKENPDLLRGDIKQALQVVGTIVPGVTKWEDVGDTIVKTGLVDTDIGALLSDYALMQSGKVVNVEELKRLKNQLGIDTGVQPEVTAAKMSEWANVQAQKARNRVKYLKYRGVAPATVAYVEQELSKIKQPDIKKTVIDASASPKVKKIDETAGAKTQAEGMPIDKLIKSKSDRAKVMKVPDGKAIRWRDGKIYIKQGDMLIPEGA